MKSYKVSDHRFEHPEANPRWDTKCEYREGQSQCRRTRSDHIHSTPIVSGKP